MSGTVQNSDVDLVRDSVDLVGLIAEHVPLRPKGREHVGLCPFHEDHSPSLTVVTHKGHAFYKCHSCGAAGDAFNFVMDYHKMSFREALELLAERSGITLRRQPSRGERSDPDRADLHRANAVAAAYFRHLLTEGPAGEDARAVIADRGISDESSETFRLGAAPDAWDGLLGAAAGKGLSTEALVAAGLARRRSSGQGVYDSFRNRLVFPICDELGRPIAFGGRRIDPEDEPKYLNSAESPVFNKSRTLYGLHLAKRAIIDARRAIVVEGYTDVVACHQAGIVNAVATLGTALTADHARILKRLCDEVVLVFDGDEAGQRAADRAVELFFAETVDVSICVLPDGLDPAALLGVPEGVERWNAALAGARDALAYKVGRFRDELAATSGLSGRHRRLEQLLESLGRLGFESLPGVRRRPVLAQLADLLGVRLEDIEQAMPGRPAARHLAPRPDAGPAPGEVSPDLWTETGDCPPARRRAERDLLSVLICQPSLRTQTVATRELPDLTLGGLLEPRRFRDPAARRLAEVVSSKLAADREFTVQELMGELDHPGLRSLAAELYLDAEKRLAHEPPPAEQFRELCAAFELLLRRERYEQDLVAYRQEAAGEAGERRTEVLQNVLEERRKQGYIPAAMPSRQRT